MCLLVEFKFRKQSVILASFRNASLPVIRRTAAECKSRDSVSVAVCWNKQCSFFRNILSEIARIREKFGTVPLSA